jgi:hypothetical protein
MLIGPAHSRFKTFPPRQIPLLLELRQVFLGVSQPVEDLLLDLIARFSTFPRTEPPPTFVEDLVSIFRKHEDEPD